ncbi:MAG: hypothetical protein NC429_02990 [Lachnospiraceae bacterium]|nr:hypothetical protein [Lachnospiraceae bacterium]
MESKKLDRRENWILALLAVLILGTAVGVCFDYYYDLNDDVLMKDILAGVYTGVPEGHNIQMLWPVSAFISLLYRLAGSLPWYGLFLCFCHFGCIFLLIKRVVSLCGRIPGKLAVTLTIGCFFGSFFLEHLIYAQYTVTCTLLGAAAAFLFYTEDSERRPGEYIRKNALPIVLVWIAYLIRSEMLLLVLPMICAAGMAKWGSEKKIFTKENARKYFGVIGLILLGLLLGEGVHRIAYSSESWRAFTEFFDNRTELYDFQKPPAYEGNESFYESIGLTEKERILLDNYNFGIDAEIDEKMMGEIAVYAGELRNERTDFVQNLAEKLKAYLYRSLRGNGAPGSDYPWNYLIILGYLAVLLTALFQRDLRVLWKLPLLAFVRSALWMYILWGERDPVRITHSLYLMEYAVLTAMTFAQWKQMESGRRKEILGGLLTAGMLGFVLTTVPARVSDVREQQRYRAEVNAPYQELYAYLSKEENSDNYYLIDVYSSVSYSEKMFENVDNSLDNYDIIGGWACKSPLWAKKLAVFGITDVEQALREREDVFFVRKISEDMDWLPAYYEERRTPVETKLVETVAGEFEIYQVSPAQPQGGS